MRRRSRARFDVLKRWFCISLDADNGQNNDRCGFSVIGAAKAHQAPIVRKFDDVTHQPPSSDTRNRILEALTRASSRLGGIQG